MKAPENKMKTALLTSFIILLSAITHADGQTILYQAGGRTCEGYFITPGQNTPLILLIHDWDGLTGYEIKRARMLAELGYTVFAADMFGRGVRPTKTNEKRKLTGALYKDRTTMRALIRGALEKAASMGADTSNAVIMGYCFGGSTVLEFARAGADLKGFISFHGGLATPEGQDYKKTKGKILVLHGSADKNVTMDHFVSLARELEMQGVSHEMITYGGAPHAFSIFGSPRYRKEADENSWKRLTDFLNKTFK